MQPDRRPKRADARRNWDRLVAEARAAFAERGIDASLDDIARRSGVGSGTLYRHFPTRDALLEAVFADAVHALADQARSLAASEPPAEALGHWLRLFVTHVTTYRGIGSRLMDAADTTEFMASCHDVIRDSLKILLEPAQRTGSVRADVGLNDLLRLVNGVALAADGSPEGADRLLALSWHGLGDGPLG